VGGPLAVPQERKLVLLPIFSDGIITFIQGVTIVPTTVAILRHLTFKNVCMFVAGIAVLAITLIVALIPTASLGTPFWKWLIFGLGVLAAVAYGIQASRQSSDDRKIEALLEDIAKGRSVPITTEPFRDSVKLSPHEELKRAQEVVFVEEVLAMSAEDLKIQLGHDPEFRNKYDSAPRGKYPKLDLLRDSVSKNPLLAAKFLHSHLLPRSPFGSIAQQLLANMGRKSYETTSDFIFEIHAVNITDASTTIQDVTAEAEIEGAWVKLPRLRDLSNYELVFRDAEHMDSPRYLLARQTA